MFLNKVGDKLWHVKVKAVKKVRVDVNNLQLVQLMFL